MEIYSTIIATIISSLVAVIFGHKTNKSNDKKALQENLDTIIKIAIEYPYLESKSFANSWKQYKCEETDSYIRYDNYCTLLFNYIERLCKHHKFNKNKIENEVYVKDWILLHRQYWEYPHNPQENNSGYSIQFRLFIEDYLK